MHIPINRDEAESMHEFDKDYENAGYDMDDVRQQVNEWKALRSLAKKRYGLTDREYERVVGNSDYLDNSPGVRAIREGNTKGLIRQDESFTGNIKWPLIGGIAIGSLPGIIGYNVARLGSRKIGAGLGALGLGAGIAATKALYDRNVESSKADNRIIDKLIAGSKR